MHVKHEPIIDDLVGPRNADFLWLSCVSLRPRVGTSPGAPAACTSQAIQIRRPIRT